MNQAASMLLAMAVGALLPIQVAMNMNLRATFRDPVLAALPNFLVGTALIAAYVLSTRTKLPSATALAQVPAWAWLGGLIGAAYVVGSLYLGPRIGATLLLALILAGRWRCRSSSTTSGGWGFRIIRSTWRGSPAQRCSWSARS